MGFISRLLGKANGSSSTSDTDDGKSCDTFNQALAKIAAAKIQAAADPGAGPIQWTGLTDHKAWFDREDALERIQARLDRKQITQQQFDDLQHWIVHGYLIVPALVDESDIDGVNDYIDDLLSTSVPNDKITLLGFTLDASKGGEAVPHAALVGLAPAQRQANARLSPWRIHELWTQCEAARNIYQNKRLIELTSLIFGCPAYPRSTINFYLGSQQELHQDMSVFHVHPGNYLIGAWVACEDISEGSGPLLYSPGSHGSAIYPPFRNYPQDTLRTCPLSEYDGYYTYMKQVAERHPVKKFLARKGDVLLWHGMLVHGGSPVVDKDLTRRSMVIHYLRDGADQTASIQGPFNWI